MDEGHLTRRMKQWIEGRVVNARRERTRISTKGLINEMEEVFHIGTPNKKLERKLKSEIERAKSRVDRRHERWVQMKTKTAEDLIVPAKIIERWRKTGFVKPCTPQGMEIFTTGIMEFAYCQLFKLTDNDIPDDPSTPLWDK